MSISQYHARLEKIENTVNSMFDSQSIGLEDDTLDFVIGPLDQKAWYNIGAWFEIALSDLNTEVLQTLVQSFSNGYLAVAQDLHLVSEVANRLQAAAKNLQDASEIWNQIRKARQEVYSTSGQLNKEDFRRYIGYTERAKDTLLGYLISSRIQLQELESTIDNIEANRKEHIREIRCPITGQACDQEINALPNQVFVGFQFVSSYYKTPSLKLMVTEGLGRNSLTPFFPDEHYEPVHISCEICHSLQQVSICIFEISDSNPNVMFELGLAYMLGKLTILLAKRGSPGTQIADIAGIHRIEYEDLIECRDFIGRCLENSIIIRNRLVG